MILRPPISTRTDTRFPYTALFRSAIAPTAAVHGLRQERGTAPSCLAWRLSLVSIGTNDNIPDVCNMGSARSSGSNGVFGTHRAKDGAILDEATLLQAR